MNLNEDGDEVPGRNHGRSNLTANFVILTIAEDKQCCILE